MNETQEQTRAIAITTPMQMLERAVSSGADVAVMSQLLELQERWQANQARIAFSASITALRKDLPVIVKSRQVDFTTAKGRTSYRYEDLADMVDILSDPLAKHGLTFRWRTDSTTNGAISVTCILEHEKGHCEETTLSGPHDTSGNKNAIQAIGSIVSYLQRYTLKAALGIAASHDDDGRQGAEKGSPPRPAWVDGFAQWRKAVGDDIYLAVLARFGVPEGGEADISEEKAVEINAAFRDADDVDFPAAKAVEQPPAPKEAAQPEPPTLEVYRALCGLYKATLGEETYHEVLAPFTADESGKSNAVSSDSWARALFALYDYARQDRPEAAPWPSQEALAEAAGMKKEDVLEGCRVFEMGIHGDAWLTLRSELAEAYLGVTWADPDKALVTPLRVYHARLCDMAWAAAPEGGDK